MNAAADQQLVKRINRSVLLRQLYQRPGLSRAQLAADIGLTKSTVSLLVRELIAEGWLAEADTAAASGMGRPSTPLHIDRTSRAMVGVEVAVNALRVVSVSLVGEVLYQMETPLPDTAPAPVCAHAAQWIAVAVRDLHQRGVQLSGIGVGVPGAVDGATGSVHFAPNLGWRDVPFGHSLRAALAQAGVPAVPLQVQNEADTAALSELEFQSDTLHDALIFVTCDVGVGAGIVLNDTLFAGTQGLAGEIGHSVLDVNGPLCSCGRRGCAEAFIGGRALQALRDVAQGGPYLGVLLQNLWTTFDPGVIVLGGPSCLAYPAMVQQALETLRHYARQVGMAPPPIRTARYGLLAAAVGAAALQLHRTLRPMQRHGWPKHLTSLSSSLSHQTQAPDVPQATQGFVPGSQFGASARVAPVAGLLRENHA